MNLKKSTYWMFCKECGKSKKVLSMEFTKENTLLIIPECQHIEREFELKEVE